MLETSDQLILQGPKITHRKNNAAMAKKQKCSKTSIKWKSKEVLHAIDLYQCNILILMWTKGHLGAIGIITLKQKNL